MAKMKEKSQIEVRSIEGVVKPYEDLISSAQTHLNNIVVQIEYLITQYMAEKGQLTAAHRAAIYAPVKEFVDEIVEATKPLATMRDIMKTNDIPEAFEREGITTITTDKGKRVTVSSLVRASIAGDKESAFEWLRTHGLGEIVTETVNASTLAAVAKTLIEEGKELDPELFTVNVLPNTSVTTVKRK